MREKNRNKGEQRAVFFGRINKTANCYSYRIKRRVQRHLKTRETFLFSLLITYLLTLGLAIGSVAIQLDNVNQLRIGFDFYSCKDLSAGMFVSAKLLETLVPTAITFSGTILILQTNASKKRSLTVWLFVVITLLVIGGILLPTAKTKFFLELYLWTFWILCLISILLCWHAFSIPMHVRTRHKREPDDGRMTFSR